MHDTAMELGERFFKTYTADEGALTVVDIGAQDVNGSLRSVAPAGCRYVGVDFTAGRGVDIIIDDPYTLPLQEASVDVVVCSSCFEHSEFFWLLFNEVMRILKPSGLFYLSVPSNGDVHRYPVDCWRFYPDSGVALQNWARRSGYRTALLESFVGPQRRECWNDFTAVFVKDEAFAERYPDRIQKAFKEFTNGLVAGQLEFTNATSETEDAQIRLGRRLWRRARRSCSTLIRKLPDGSLRRALLSLGQP